ncbi:hypothetical protein D3C76_1679010 [compost metagenome]
MGARLLDLVRARVARKVVFADDGLQVARLIERQNDNAAGGIVGHSEEFVALVHGKVNGVVPFATNRAHLGERSVGWLNLE